VKPDVNIVEKYDDEVYAGQPRDQQHDHWYDGVKMRAFENDRRVLAIIYRRFDQISFEIIERFK